jgi:hypothetical protein
MHWHMSPSLLVAMDSLNRCAKKFGHLLLRLVQSLTEGYEFFAVHAKFKEPFIFIVKRHLTLLPRCGTNCQQK